MTSVYDYGIDKQIDRQLDEFASKSLNDLKDEGALVCVVLEEWKWPDFNGFRASRFLNIFAIGRGRQPEVLLAKFQSYGSIAPDNDGWRVKNVFFWITK